MKKMSAVFRFLLTVFLTALFALPLEARDDESRLHIPWPLFESRLQGLLAGDSSLWKTVVGDMPLPANGMTWNLKNLRFDAQVTSDRPVFDGTHLSLRLPKVGVRVGLDSVSVDQVITREVSGVVVNVHLKAQCGPIRLIQENAQSEAVFAVDWSTGAPAARLQQLNLGWDDGSWQMSEFSCEGPQGMDRLLEAEVLKQLKDPQVVKPYLADWLSRQLQEKLTAALASLKTPLSLADGDIQLHVGAMVPASTGLLVPLMLQKDAPALPVPSTLASLPKDKPVFLVGTAVLQTLLEAQLAKQPELITVDLRTFSAFKTLIGSRFLQFFVWPDLMNYAKSAPFYGRIQRPSKLTLKSEGGARFSSPVDLRAVIQSQRSGRWWDYVTMSGQARALVQLSLSGGQLNYATSLNGVSLATGFGQDYKKQFGYTGWLPTSALRSGLEGSQPSLSGSVQWPDVDLGLAGSYRAKTLNSFGSDTLLIQFETLK